ncbi:ATP-binding protein [Bengtsoniella intestinalis]|uniref:sensor histidine kinase n=1 Tax=Bengtsoniella intestinalis TaxID=3073143 RepID=UPI00391EEFB0
MSKRIFRAICAICCGTMVLWLMVVVGFLHSHTQETLNEQLEVQARYIAHGVEEMGMDFLEDTDHVSRVTWVDADGIVLFDSQSDAQTMENHSERPEIIEATEAGSGDSIRYSYTLDETTVYYAVALNDGSILRVSDGLYTVWEVLLEAVRPMIVVLCLVAVLAFFLARRIANALVRPINAIDLSNPSIEDADEELTPLLQKLRSQRRQIRHQMQQLTRRQEEFEAITENMREGLVVLDGMGMVLSSNRAALELFGTENSRNRDIHVLELSRNSALRQCVEQTQQGHSCYLTTEGQDSCLELIASPVQEGKVGSGAVLIIRDITEKEHRDRLRREFTANVSHELKTPLTAILGTAEIIKEGFVKPEDVPRFATNIHTESERLIRLVNDIIKISRLDEGEMGAHWEVVDLWQVVGDVTARLQTAAQQKNVTFILDGSSQKIHGLPPVVDEVVYNLCDNAIAYNNEGGKVIVHLHAVAEEICLQVTDTGVGIALDAQKRVFERFFRLDSSRSSRGTGLGLSIVKHGAAYLGAELGLESQEGVGSTFTVMFPKCPEELL